MRAINIVCCNGTRKYLGTDQHVVLLYSESNDQQYPGVIPSCLTLQGIKNSLKILEISFDILKKNYCLFYFHARKVN